MEDKRQSQGNSLPPGALAVSLDQKRLIKNTRELILRAALATVFALALFFAGAMVWLWAASGFDPYFMQIDTCLDSGGRWNYETCACEMRQGLP